MQLGKLGSGSEDENGFGDGGDGIARRMPVA